MKAFSSLDLKLGLRMLIKYAWLTMVGGLGMAVAVAIAAIALIAAAAPHCGRYES